MNNLAQLRLQTYSPRPSRLQQLPIHILLEIQKHLGYLGSISLKCVNRYFKEIIDPTLCSVDDKIEGVMYAEQNFRQHYPGRLSALPAGDERRGKREWELKNPGNFGCYHCFRVLAPEQFELFKWNITVDRTEDSNEDEGAVQLNIDSLAPNHHHSSSSLSGVGMGMGMGMGIGGSATGTTATACLTGADYCISPRVKSTWGVRRFCIPCGIRLKFYKPGDLIYLQRASRDQAAWICHCWKTHVRPAELSCQDCGSFVPLSTPTRRRS
ncbi:hypothetical protein QBC46DRAFT_262651 [Diplogelasinospora grovesii]|uniref:F-box domain-containing protein n=1 Tax=Diplogelasinospora grovesii TaxID=303347 RepID=A0AAN6N8F8_9PEZI|nr:hypothetical protein QBC46DRAFT_262651 [Diplogelasinospora grovesii]